MSLCAPALSAACRLRPCPVRAPCPQAPGKRDGRRADCGLLHVAGGAVRLHHCSVVQAAAAHPALLVTDGSGA